MHPHRGGRPGLSGSDEVFDPDDPDHVPGAKVVAAYKGGSADIASSRERVDRFTAELRDKWGVEIVDDERVTEDLIKKVSSRVAQRLLKEFS